MTTTVTYHRDDYGPARPAINVKLHAAGLDFWPEGWSHAAPFSFDREAIVERAYERTASDFWQAAEELADQYGIGPITQEGRSGGWLVFDNPRRPDPVGPEVRRRERREFLAGYRAMSAWAAQYIADAPERIARLAQDMAMDELGARAVNRPYRELTLTEYRASGAETFYGTGR